MTTIKLKSALGVEHNYTREEYQKTWVAEISQFYNLTRTDEEYEMVRKMKEQAKELAGREFDRLLRDQS